MYVNTFVEVLGQLTGVSTAIGAALLDSGALAVLLAALHAGGSEAAGLLRGGAVALLRRLHGLQELTARQTLVVLLGEKRLRRMFRDRKQKVESGGGKKYDLKEKPMSD